eukprot:TRINITY_DN113336_c0_g1_i1.p1 TRINITY_DN113336_c0_g1~~TRINITY_DN113336_c0_g1_i1.p1  ORF type:complete len:276 (+),score=25.88 TRINITY_DN113336_c0_g1_i1:32-859(+)
MGTSSSQLPRDFVDVDASLFEVYETNDLFPEPEMGNHHFYSNYGYHESSNNIYGGDAFDYHPEMDMEDRENAWGHETPYDWPNDDYSRHPDLAFYGNFLVNPRSPSSDIPLDIPLPRENENAGAPHSYPGRGTAKDGGLRELAPKGDARTSNHPKSPTPHSPTDHNPQPPPPQPVQFPQHPSMGPYSGGLAEWKKDQYDDSVQSSCCGPKPKTKPPPPRPQPRGRTKEEVHQAARKKMRRFQDDVRRAHNPPNQSAFPGEFGLQGWDPPLGDGYM